MKKIFSWIREKTGIILNHIIIFFTIMIILEEYINSIMVVNTIFVILSFVFSNYFIKKLRKYEFNLKLKHYVGNIIINITLFITYVFIYNILGLDNIEYTLFDSTFDAILTLLSSIIIIIINYIYWLLLFKKNKEAINKKYFNKKIIKYMLSSIFLFLYIFIC